MTLDELRSLAQSVGFPDPSLAAAVAMAESGGVPTAVGDSGNSFGLWQVNIPSHPQYDGQSLLDPKTNAQAALAISKNGSDWTPWTTYRTGAYKKYMPGIDVDKWRTVFILAAIAAGGIAYSEGYFDGALRRVGRLLPG